jgi:hypothetical protein
MQLLLEHGAGQAASLLAVQAVRSAAAYALAVLTHDVSDDEDIVGALWSAVPALRACAVLQLGADVIALHDDLTLYAYTPDNRETDDLARAAEAFCAWALALQEPAEVAAGRLESASS